MNPSDPQLKNVTPAVPLAPPPSPPMPSTGVPTHAASPPSARPRSRVPLLAIVLVVVALAVGYKLFHHHRNAYEATADAVTRAIVANDMTPVVHKFSDRLQGTLTNHAHVGELADSLQPLGKFDGSTEITPPGSGAGFHEFQEHFANATWIEKYELDADGKIVHFHIGPK